jgi:chromosomal replication initiator protein
VPVTDDPDHTWSRITGELRQRVPADTYEIWLAPLQPVTVEGSEVVVEAPRELRAWVVERFARVLQASAIAVLGPGAVIRVRAGDEGPSAAVARARAASPAPAARPDEQTTGLNPKYRFEQFVIGDANRFAHAAALAVAELPGQAYNPLFIYGPPGVGKTHLLHSIGNYVEVCGGGLRVRYTTVETFTNQFIAAVNAGSMDRFKGRFRRNDVLLIDDVQFLASKAKTEEEFFHTFNALYEVGSQLVLTSDRMPRDLDAVEDRLRERFEAGLVTAIRAPDLATRVTVLRKRAQHDGIDLADDDVLTLIAEAVPTNIRALEGALIRVVA